MTAFTIVNTSELVNKFKAQFEEQFKQEAGKKQYTLNNLALLQLETTVSLIDALVKEDELQMETGYVDLMLEIGTSNTVAQLVRQAHDMDEFPPAKDTEFDEMVEALKNAVVPVEAMFVSRALLKAMISVNNTNNGVFYVKVA